MRLLPRLTALAVVLSLLVHPSAVGGQSEYNRDSARPYDGAALPTWAGEAVLLGTNAALGGVSAGIFRELRGGSFWEGLRDGALGGAIAYAGKRITVERFEGAGLLGREIAAVGSSIVRNASAGQPALAEVVLPIGVGRLYLRRHYASAGAGLRHHFKFDLPTLITTAYLAARSDADLDLGASLSAGAPVFVTSEYSSPWGWVGYQAAGAVWLRDDTDAADDSNLRRPPVLAHERVHVLQYDFAFLAWGDPAEQWLTDRLPGGEWIDHHLDLGVDLAGWGLANLIVPYQLRPWEQEAHFLSGTSWIGN